MRKVSLLFLAVCLLSCGGGDFTNSEVTPDVNIPDASDDIQDVDDASSNDVTDTSVNDVANDVIEKDSTTDTLEDSSPDSAECVPGELSCQGKTPVFCNGGGQLQTKPECEYLCENGTCVGECNPGDERCLDKDVELCDSSATWQVTSVCPIKCEQNICNGTWCCQEVASGDCQCLVHQVCNSVTGELKSCDGITSQCCYYGEAVSGPRCFCLADWQADCQYIVDNQDFLGLANAKVVDSCPE